LGVKNKNIAPWMDRFAVGASALIFLGYISIPVSVVIKDWLDKTA
jgi:hypothetical protein